MQIKVTMNIELPNKQCTPDQIKDWVRYVVGARGFLEESNPFIHTELEAENVIIS
jgi:hypothetical protein